MHCVPIARKFVPRISLKYENWNQHIDVQVRAVYSLAQLYIDVPSICETVVVFLSSSIKFSFVHISEAYNDFISFSVYIFDLSLSIFVRCTQSGLVGQCVCILELFCLSFCNRRKSVRLHHGQSLIG